LRHAATRRREPSREVRIFAVPTAKI